MLIELTILMLLIVIIGIILLGLRELGVYNPGDNDCFWIVGAFLAAAQIILLMLTLLILTGTIRTSDNIKPSTVETEE